MNSSRVKDVEEEESRRGKAEEGKETKFGHFHIYLEALEHRIYSWLKGLEFWKLCDNG
jgi:hypothetical protein